MDGHDYLSVIYSGHQSTEAGFPSASDFLVAWNYEVKPGNGMQLYVDKGLSNGSPNYGAGAGAYTRF